jgi:protein tyrosine/serine phosphatase
MNRYRVSFCAPVVLLLLVTSLTFAQDKSNTSQLPAFAQVSERLFRGGQPRTGGFQQLSSLGIKTIINLRGTSQRTRLDEQEATALGMRYYNIPMPVWGRPRDSHVLRILEVINSPDSGPTFIHCRDGVDRTGTITALYRMTYDGWSAEAASAEAGTRGMRRHQIWMREYIRDFSARWQPSDGEQEGRLMVHGNRDEFYDRLGSGVRKSERAVFTTERGIRKFARGMHGVFGSIF